MLLPFVSLNSTSPICFPNLFRPACDAMCFPSGACNDWPYAYRDTCTSHVSISFCAEIPRLSMKSPCDAAERTCGCLRASVRLRYDNACQSFLTCCLYLSAFAWHWSRRRPHCGVHGPSIVRHPASKSMGVEERQWSATLIKYGIPGFALSPLCPLSASGVACSLIQHLKQHS